MVLELFKRIEDYLRFQTLVDKDKFFQALRRRVEHPGQREIGSLDEEFEIPVSQFGPEKAEEISVLISLLKGYLLASAFRHREAEIQFGEVLSQTSHQIDLPFLYLTGRALLAKALSLSETGNNHQAMEQIRGAEPLIEQLNLPALKAEHAHIKGLAHRRLGENELAFKVLNESMEICQGLEDDHLLARVEDTLGLTCLDLGWMDEAELHFQRSLARKTRLGDLRGMAYTLGNLGRYYARQEQDDLALSYLRRELDLCEELGDIKGSMVSLRGLARLAWKGQQWTQAADYLKRVEGLVHQVDEPFSEAYLALTWADFYLSRGQWEESRPHHQKALELFGPEPGDFIQARLELQAARIAAGRGESDKAQEKFKKAHEIFEGLKRPTYLAEEEFDWGMWLVKEQRLDEAAGHITKAINLARGIEAEKMAAGFAAACENIGTEHWLQAICKVKEMSDTLATEKARFEKMAETIIHDLKNKMIIINLALKRMKAKGHTDDPLLEYLSQAQNLGSYMEHLLMNYLQGFRFSEGQAPGNGQSLEIAPLVEGLKQVFFYPLQEKKLQLVVSPGPVGLKAQINPQLFHLILSNLLDNAIKYTPKGKGTIRVEVSEEPDCIRMAVIDPGDGIPEELQERIFQKWGRVEGGEVTYSTGLGLYHTKVMVETMGGKIGVTSEVGHGSTFWFTVPVVK